MDNNFFGKVYKNFVENEFILVNGSFDNAEISSESKYVGVYKVVGNLVYCVFLINKIACKDEYKEYIKIFRSKFIQIACNANVEKFIFLNIIITDKADEDTINFMNGFSFYNDFEYNDLCWIAEKDNNKIISNKNQPDKILNINKILLTSFSDNQAVENVDFYEVSQNVQKKSKYEVKSQNILITFLLIIINFIVFTIMELNGGSESIKNLISFGAVSSDLVFVKGQYFRLFTDMFVHIGLAHLLSNSLSLYILGSRSERYFGKILFLIIYILSGIGASFASILFTDGISAGASGAIFGIMGAMLIQSIITNKSMGDFSGYFMVLFSLVNIGAGFFMTGVDNAGHIGGFLTGCIISLVYNLFKKTLNYENK